MIPWARFCSIVLWGFILWMLSGCTHETVFTQTDIHMYGGLGGTEVPVLSDTLVCVSYNIAFSEKLDQALIDLTAGSIPKNPDIILLQEMHAQGAAYLADRLGMNYYYFPSFIHPHHGRLFGNAVLSTWPLSEPEFTILPHANPLTENFRSALAVDVKIRDRIIRVVSVHLATLIVDQQDRVEQAVVLRDSLVAPFGPTIIGGDFNSGTNYEGTLFRRVMREAGFREIRTLKGRTARGGALDLFGYRLKLDHIYYRELKFLSAGVCREAIASDHFPIWGMFAWEN